MLTAVLSGCVRDSDREGRAVSTVVLAAPEISYMLPDWSDADFLLFLPLATRDPEGELVPRLAKSWDPSADWREVTYHLRTDVRWHDGVPVTAHDVKFTLDLLAHPDLAEYAFDSVAVVDDSTVLIHNHNHWYVDDVVFYPRHLLDDLEPGTFFAWDFWNKPVGNGPYRFVRYVPETLMELASNPDHYSGEPPIRKVIVRFLGSDDAGMTELLAGNVDAAESRNLVARDALARDPRFNSYVRFGGAFAVLFVNHNRPLFADARVRKAMVLALDRPELGRAIGLPGHLPLVDAVFTLDQLVRQDLPRAFEHDPEQSRRLLEEAGWSDLDGDGIRERDGLVAKFTIRAPPWWERTMVLIERDLAEVGLDPDVLLADGAVNLEHYRQGDFDVAVGFFTPYRLDLLSSPTSTSGYGNEHYKALVRQAEATPSPAIRDSLIYEAWPIMIEDVPAIFLHPMATQFYVHERIRGLSTPWRADPARYMDELWIEE
jgi:peptide/nickel transport system substrate-binding protein